MFLCIVLSWVVAGSSINTMRIHENNSVDMVFIDGDHTYEGELRNDQRLQ